MTIEDLLQKYTGLAVDTEKADELLRHMGKFGKITVYSFSFETDTATISVEACIKAGKFSSFTPEKEKRIDEWGYSTEEYTEEFTAEECSRIDKYFFSILA